MLTKKQCKDNSIEFEKHAFDYFIKDENHLYKNKNSKETEMNQENFKKIGHVKYEHIELWNLRYPNYDTEFTEKDKIEIEQWNCHDWKNVIAFKSIDAWLNFIHAIEHLIGFYNQMKHTNEVFKIFYKSYNKDNLNELQNDICNFIREIYWDDILEVTENGYFIVYFTTQRECHDKNQFLMYMLDGWRYDRHVIGHMLNEEDIIKDIEFIAVNEK